MKVVADTNVLVSAFIFPGGSPEAFYRLALEGRIELVSSRPLLAELGRVLTAKFGWEADRAEEAVAQVVRIGEIVEPSESVSEIAGHPADNRVLEAAAEAGVDAIVSGDRHLLRCDPGAASGVRPPSSLSSGRNGAPEIGRTSQCARGLSLGQTRARHSA